MQSIRVLARNLRTLPLLFRESRPLLSGCAPKFLPIPTLQQRALLSTSMRLLKSPDPLQPGLEAPDFEVSALVKGQLGKAKLSDYKGKYLVLFFYPADFTFVCPTEIIAFNDRAKEFTELGCELVACSTDTAFVHHAWTQVPRNRGGLGKMDITILADRTQKIARAYNVLSEQGHAFRGLFVINQKGIIRCMQVNDMPIGRSVDEALRLVQACIHFDKNGEVCPANWKPGTDAMKPGPDSEKYFNKHY